MEILYFAVLALMVATLLLQIQINKLKSENKELRNWHLNLHEHVNYVLEKQISINENTRKSICTLYGLDKED